MKRFILHVAAGIALTGTAFIASSTNADESAVGGTLAIASFTIDNGGGESSGGDWNLHGTAGQPDPGVANGGTFVVSGGFWMGGAVASCSSDLTGDGQVGFEDVVQLLNDWGPCGGGACDSDLDGNGDVGFTDLLLVLNDYGPC